MGKSEALIQAFGRLTRTDWAFLHFKASIGIMLMVPISQLESIKDATNQLFIVAWLGVTLLGFWISLVGLVLSAQRGSTRRRGFQVEMIGLILLLSGPVVFLLIQAGLWHTTGRDRGLAMMFCYVIASAILARMVMVKSAAKSRTVIFRYKEEGVADD